MRVSSGVGVRRACRMGGSLDLPRLNFRDGRIADLMAKKVGRSPRPQSLSWTRGNGQVRLGARGLEARERKEREASPPFHCETAFAWPWPPGAPRDAQSSDCGEPAGSRQSQATHPLAGVIEGESSAIQFSSKEPEGGLVPNMRLGDEPHQAVRATVRSQPHELERSRPAKLERMAQCWPNNHSQVLSGRSNLLSDASLPSPAADGLEAMSAAAAGDRHRPHLDQELRSRQLDDADGRP